MDSFFLIEMQSAGTQVLESAYIIATSKNIETIKGRYVFLSQRIESLRQGQNNSQYITCIQSTIENYKRIYYDWRAHSLSLAL